MRHISTAAAAFAAEGFNPGADQVDCANFAGQVIGYGSRNRRLAVVDRDYRRNARNHARLGLVKQAAQIFGVEPIEHLARELDPADILI